MVARGWLSVLLVATACGRVNFDPLGEASGDAPGGTACATFGPFGNAQQLAATMGQGAAGASVSGNGLALYFHSGSLRLFRASRADTTMQFAAPVHIAELSLGGFEAGPGITADELEIVYVSNRSGQTDVWSSRRASPGATFPAPVQPFAPAPQIRDGPDISADGTQLFYTYGAIGTMREIHWASRPNVTTAFTDHGPRADVNTTSDEALPSLSSEGLEVYFRSNRSGTARIWVARRSTPTDTFGAATPLAELDPFGAIDDPEIAENGTAIYFTSGGNIWRAERSCL